MKFIILDRDGVINHDSEHYIKNPNEWLPIDNSLNAITDLNKAGYQVLIATNQSGVSRGLYDLAMLEKIHIKLQQEVAKAGGKITEIFFCPHHPDDKCDCRKPEPGMFYKIRDKYGVNLQETYFIGDSIVDIRVARAVGCIPGLVLTGNGKKTIENYPEAKYVKQFTDLAEVAKFLSGSK